MGYMSVRAKLQGMARRLKMWKILTKAGFFITMTYAEFILYSVLLMGIMWFSYILELYLKYYINKRDERAFKISLTPQEFISYIFMIKKRENFRRR